MFEAAGARFNNDTGFYELNGLTDLTENDMLSAYRYYTNSPMSGGNGYKGIYKEERKARTFFPKDFTDGYVGFESAFAWCSRLEVVKFSNRGIMHIDKSYAQCFMGCLKLHTILDTIEYLKTATINGTSAFFSCVSLRNVRIKNVNRDLSFSDSPLLSLESLTYLIDNSAAKDSITVTVHPDVYAKLTDPENLEWNALITKATEKQIQFATI